MTEREEERVAFLRQCGVEFAAHGTRDLADAMAKGADPVPPLDAVVAIWGRIFDAIDGTRRPSRHEVAVKIVAACFLASAELVFWLTVFHRCPCAPSFVIAVAGACGGLVAFGWLLGALLATKRAT